ncbi:MAG TPA: PEP-CTERM sorting domain-containing protein [Opitutus sp.]|nr:PEP-CTERM sorting domain-containing protein [Opitutus sp.]
MLKRCLALFCVAAACASAQTTIYFDDFSGSSSTDLTGTTPDISSGGATWIADTGGSAWKADGSISNSGASNAFLSFAPSAGHVYTLSIDANPVNGNGDWFAIGFSQLATVNSIYAGGSVSASAWMLLRGDRTDDLETFLGPGTGDEVDFNPPDDITLSPGSVNLKVILDTTGAQWTAEWVVNNVSIRQTTFDTNPTINYVGLGRWSTASGTVDNFTLTSTSAIPEPATCALTLGTLAAGAVMLRRRRRRPV